MNRRLRSQLLVICLIPLLLLIGCSDSGGKSEDSQGKAQTGKKAVTIGITNAPGSLNPLDTTGLTSATLAAMLFHPLVELDESLKFVPRLADSIETTDNQTYLVKLNPNAKWTDGEPVTADDVLFTIRLIANPKVLTKLNAELANVAGLDDLGKLPQGQTELPGVVKIDDHTVEFRMKHPVTPDAFKEGIGKRILYLPKHVLQAVDPEKLHQDPFMQKLSVTNGPFTFVTYQKDQFVEFAANKTYFLGAPKLDKLYFKITTPANMVAQLQNGEIDMNFPGIGEIPIQDYERVKHMPNIRTISGLPLKFQVMFINTQTISNPRLRQAIIYAVNRQLLVESLLKGEGEVIDGLYTPIHPYFNKSKKTYEYNPEKAKQLLKEANWDSSRVLTFNVSTGNKTREQACDIIVENLKAVGINVQVQKYDFQTSAQKAMKHENDLTIMGLEFILDPDVSVYLQSDSPYNLSAYTNPTMDELLMKGKLEMDQQKRREIYDSIQEMVALEVPLQTIYVDYRLKAVSNKVIAGEPKEIGMLNNVNEWDIEN